MGAPVCPHLLLDTFCVKVRGDFLHVAPLSCAVGTPEAY
jgi:hypothetical protein